MLPLPLLALLLATPVMVTGPRAVLGTWYMEHEKSDIHVTITETNGEYRGTISWMEEPAYPEGHPRAGETKADRRNPEEDLRDRPVLGIELLYGFRWDEGDREWKDGRIYSPDSGRTYRCTLKLAEDGRLEVRGFKKIGFAKIGRSMYWTRVDSTASPPGTGD